ncbi:hypothetical protein [Streptomyces sp. 8N706]|uniref:hypothetical protein n=1 Tax=Streptomyces sp. 8N706 TaxID=3457416 RepID=UPI003FD03551
MPRPTAAQLAYGSATVIFSTLAMLLLSQTRSGAGVMVIAVAGLVLGLLVAMTVTTPRPAARTARPARAPRTAAAARPVRSAAPERHNTLPRPRAHTDSRPRVGEHSLRR